MTTPSGIQDRLHKRADDELKTVVDAITNTCNNDLNRIIPGNYPTHGMVALKKSDDVVFSQSAERLLRDIGMTMVERLTDRYRENTVTEFMEKIDTLHDQIDELRDEIQFD